jgi:hypothetical protein
LIYSAELREGLRSILRVPKMTAASYRLSVRQHSTAATLLAYTTTFSVNFDRVTIQIPHLKWYFSPLGICLCVLSRSVSNCFLYIFCLCPSVCPVCLSV